MGRNTVSLLFLYCFLAYSSPEVKADDRETPEHGSVDLECGFPNLQYKDRFWHLGYFTDAPPREALLFAQSINGLVENFTDRSDLSVNSQTFTLTIGHVTLEDDTNFTCEYLIKFGDKRYMQHRPRVYIQPNDTDIQIGGVDRNFTKGEKVTVSCTVNRLYPKITSVGSFTITWGDDANTTKEYDSIGTDKAFKYAVTITKTLNITDDGTTVECDLQPEIGTAVHLEKTVIVQYGPVGQPKIETNATDPIPCTDVVLTCHHESVSANPVVNKVNWTKDGVSLERNEKNFQYIVRNVDKKDNGSYRCSVGNDIGYSRVSENITLTVNFSAFYAPRGDPELIVNNTQPIKGESVILNCSTSNIDSYFPLISYNWIKNGVPHTEWANASVILSVMRSDSANYSCSVGNFIGDSSDSNYVYLDVLYGPTHNPVLSINVTGEVDEGDSVAFTCDTSGIQSNPKLTIVKWTKDGQDIEWSNTSFSQIIKVTATDHGIYGCMVGNVIKGTPTYSDLPGLVELKVKGGGGGGDPGGSSQTGPIVGGVVGGLAVIALVVVILLVVLRKRRDAKNNDNSSSRPMVNMNQSNTGTLDSVGYSHDNGGEAQYDEVASPMRPVPSARKPQIKPKPGSKPAHQVDGEDQYYDEVANPQSKPSAQKPQIKPKPTSYLDGATANPPTTYSSSGDLYAQIDKSKKESELTYAELDLPNKRQAPKPAPRQEKKVVIDEPPTDYAEVDWEKTRAQRM